MTNHLHELRLVFPRPAGDATAIDADHVVVLPGVFHLEARAGERPVVTERAPTARGAAHLVEAVARGSESHIVLLSPTGASSARMNGAVAPRVTLLSEGDEVRVGEARAFHVALYRHAALAKADGTAIGKMCPVCRTRIEDGSTVYSCACGAVVHAETAEEKSEADRLECASVGGECPVCHAPIVTAEGYARLPEPSEV